MKTEIPLSIIENFKSFQILLYTSKNSNNILKVEENTIIIDNCIFKEDLIIDNKLDQTKSEIVYQSRIAETEEISIKFTNCVFESDFIIEEIKFKDLSLVNCFINHRFLTNSNTTINNVWISKVLANSRFEIRGSFMEIDLHYSEFKSRTFFNDVRIKENFKITDCKFNSKCRFIGGKYEKYFTINSSDFETIFSSLFEIDDTVEFDSKILIRGVNFKNDANFSYKSMTSSSSLSIEGIDYCEGKKGSFKNLTFSNLPPKTIIEGVNIAHFQLKNIVLNDKNSLLVYNSKYNKIYFENFTNFGFFTFNSVSPLNELGLIEIANSNLGKLDFISCNLLYTELIIDNTKLIDVFYTDTIFPHIINSNKVGLTEKLKQQSDTYGQMKSVSEKVGNRFNALQFQSKEMAAYYSSKMYGFEDFIILFLLKWSNNFKQSPLRGVLFTLIIGVIPYILYIKLALNDFTYGCYSFADTFEVFRNHFFGYFEFLNPTHKSDYLGEIYSKEAYLWDFLGRIFIGFGIYQTIQAFRKFGKEGS